MRTKPVRTFTLAAVVAAACLTAAASASAAAEVGSRCVANSPYPGTLVQSAGNGDHAFPTAGVITRWGSVVQAFPGTIPTKLKVFRPTASPVEFQLIGESEIQNVTGGSNEFPTRIPVAAGDLLGTFGTGAGALYCTTPSNPSDAISPLSIGATEPVVGSTYTAIVPTANYRLAAYAKFEPDADGDGYGDETQDLCSVSAAVFDKACPVIALSRFLIPGARSLQVVVASNVEAPLTLSGSASVPAYDGKRARRIKFKSVKSSVAPGQLKRLSLR